MKKHHVMVSKYEKTHDLKKLAVWLPNCKANRIFDIDFAGFKLLNLLLCNFFYNLKKVVDYLVDFSMHSITNI